MKRILIAVFVGAVAVMCMVIVLTPGHSKRRPMGLAFVGFTNTLGRTEALFWFTNSAETNFSLDRQDWRWLSYGWEGHQFALASA